VITHRQWVVFLSHWSPRGHAIIANVINMITSIVKQHIWAREGEKLLHLTVPCKHSDKEATRDLEITYASGFYSQADWLSYDNRLSALAVVLLLLHSPVGEEEEKALAPLYTAGLEAARIARHRQKWKPTHPMQIDI
jgi:hypothetical protein